MEERRTISTETAWQTATVSAVLVWGEGREGEEDGGSRGREEALYKERTERSLEGREGVLQER